MKIPFFKMKCHHCILPYVGKENMIIGALHANEEDTCRSDIFMEINLYIL